MLVKVFFDTHTHVHTHTHPYIYSDPGAFVPVITREESQNWSWSNYFSLNIIV